MGFLSISSPIIEAYITTHNRVLCIGPRVFEKRKTSNETNRGIRWTSRYTPWPALDAELPATTDVHR